MLRNTLSEKKYGFVSLLWVRFVECGTLNSIKTSKSHHVLMKAKLVYRVSANNAGAMIYSGLSYPGKQKSFVEPGVPPVKSRTLRKREK